MLGCDFLATSEVTETTETELENEVEKEIEKASAGNRRYLKPSEIVAFLLTTFGQKT